MELPYETAWQLHTEELEIKFLYNEHTLQDTYKTSDGVFVNHIPWVKYRDKLTGEVTDWYRVPPSLDEMLGVKELNECYKFPIGD